MEPEVASQEAEVFTAKVNQTRWKLDGANATEPDVAYPDPMYAARLNAVRWFRNNGQWKCLT